MEISQFDLLSQRVYMFMRLFFIIKFTKSWQVLRILEGNFLVERLDQHQEQFTSILLNPSLGSYNSSKDTLSRKQEKSQHQKPMGPVTKLSSIALKLENRQDIILKPQTAPHKHEINEKYQEYLHGSLHKHIQSFNKK